MNVYHVLGNVTERSLLDIWRGEEAQALRRAMEVDDLSLGCDICQWQVDRGRSDLAFSRWFEDMPVDGPEPAWPSQLELSISNTCNLQCVMCNGEWSSSIRSQREGLPPLPKVYDDSFFEGLEPFLPHLRRVKFLGGEPFLAAETLRVMEMLVDANPEARCHVTTNGTQWTPRVERIMDMLPVDVAVSIDGATAETYESIRQGSSWDVVMRNLDRFQEIAERKGTDVTITFCLMTVNWHEFADFCRMADERDIGCAVNVVSQPEHLTLYQLSVPELEKVMAGLDAVEAAEGDSFGLSRATWTGELDKLRTHLDDRKAGRSVTGLDETSASDVAVRPSDRSDQVRRAADVEALRRRSTQLVEENVGLDATHLVLDRDGVITDIHPGPEILGVPIDALRGVPGRQLVDSLAEHVGAVDAVETDHEEGEDRLMRLCLADGRVVRVVATPALEDDGRRVGTWVYLAWAEPAAAELS